MITFKPVKSFPTRDLTQLVPSAQESLKAVLAECVKRGIQIFLTQTYRSYEYQAQLNKEMPNGAAKPGKSMHEFRMAVDIACKGKDLYNAATLHAAQSVFRAHGWTCGSDWGDGPHMQYCTVAEQKKIYELKTPDKIEAYLKAR